MHRRVGDMVQVLISVRLLKVDLPTADRTALGFSVICRSRFDLPGPVPDRAQALCVIACEAFRKSVQNYAVTY